MTYTKSAVAAAVLALGVAVPGYAAPAANPSGPEGSTNAGVKTPSSGGNEVSPRAGPLPGKSSTSVMPDRTPRTTNEAGDARPEEKTTRVTKDSAGMPNPKTPPTVNEAGDARPLERSGATSGATGSGTR